MRFAAVCMIVLLSAAASAHALLSTDPCKILSAKQIGDTLGLAEPVTIERYAEATPRAWAKLVDLGFGNLGYAISLEGGAMKDDFTCRGRSGDLDLLIRVRTAHDARADRDEHLKEHALAAKKWGDSFKSKSYGTTTCEEALVPASDLLGRERHPEMVTERIGCFEDRGSREISMLLRPQLPKKLPPSLIDSLAVLVADGANRL